MADFLLEKLQEYSESDVYPLHMPGHKRRLGHFTDPFAIDITEIDGFDNLHHAREILLEAQQRAARLYGAEETFYLVNGSTCGILAAVSAAAKRGERILLARNCHKAAYHAVLLNDLRAVYLYPEADMIRGINGAIHPEQVEAALSQYPDIGIVLITSPTYDGVVLDVRRIAEITHRYGAVLIVDEAHGAHFVMHPYFPDSAVLCGADIVINSLHKTMPSLTQTALLHVQGQRINRERLGRYLGIYQSSSPSYVLMAGMDACIRLMQERGGELFAVFTEQLEGLRAELARLQVLYLIDGNEKELYAYNFDRSKVVISTAGSGLTGPGLSGILRRKYHLEVEMEAENYVTAIMTVCDTPEGFERLGRALLEIDEELAAAATEMRIKPEPKGVRKRPAGPEGRDNAKQRPGAMPHSPEAAAAEGRQREYTGLLSPNEEVLTICQAENSDKIKIALAKSQGQISAEFAYLYPPGIPLLVPGERIPENLPERLAHYQAIGLHLQGLSDFSGETIWVVKDPPGGDRKSG